MATDDQVNAWLQGRGWQAFPFQREVWAQMAAGRSGLLHASTGAGKTLAVWLGALQALPAEAKAAGSLSVLWVTPMRALSHDTLLALQDAARDLAPSWTLAARTGDTSSSERSAQQKRWPTGLVTTPESLSLLLARADAPTLLKQVRLVVVDEWHELMGSKRGVQLQLALARLRRWHPGLMTWGLSATLANLDDARDTLAPGAVLVQGAVGKTLTIDTLLPQQVERFAWAGHMGLAMRPAVVAHIDAAASTLVFTNTRSQAERWFQALLEARPDWAGQIALHHGSLDAEARRWVEAAMKAGLHRQPRPGRGLPAGRAGAADRLGQGRGAAGAARRPLGPCAGPRIPHHPGAHQQLGAGGGLGPAGRGASRPHRAPPHAAGAAGRAGAAPGHGGAGRRLQAG